MTDRDFITSIRDQCNTQLGTVVPPGPVEPPPPTGGGGGGGGGGTIPPATGGMDISDGAIRTLGYVYDNQITNVWVNRPGMIEVVPVSGTQIKSRTDNYGTESGMAQSASYQRQVQAGTYSFSVESIGGNIAVVFRG